MTQESRSTLQTETHINISDEQRRKYIFALKNTWLLNSRPNPEDAPLMPWNQGLLNLLEYSEGQIAGGRNDRPLSLALDQTSKASLLKAVENSIGHRPETFTFGFNNELDAESKKGIEELLDRYPAVYLKQSRSALGLDVFRVAREEESYGVSSSKYGEVNLNSLSDIRLPIRFLEKGSTYLAEAEIPIPKTSDGSTWEIRNIPPYSSDFTIAKVGLPGKPLNNVSQGGHWEDPAWIMYDVIRTHFPNISLGEVEEKSNKFMAASYELSLKVKDIVDTYLIDIAKRIIKPEDLRDPDTYDEFMETCFSGNFFVVDITGVFDEFGNLTPVIIEAQDNAALPNKSNYIADTLGTAAGERATEETRTKLAVLRKSLK